MDLFSICHTIPWVLPNKGLPMTAPLYAPRYNSSWALVVGVGKYQASAIHDLRGPVSDAEDIAEVLINIYNFPSDHVTLLTDDEATGNAIRDNLEALTTSRIKPDDRVLIYFSGHGIVRPGKQTTYYIVPTDAIKDKWNSLISQDDLLTTRRHIAAKHVLYIIDACHSGSIVTDRKEIAPDLENLLTHGSWQAMGAGLPDQTVFAALPGDKNSLFTVYLLRGLRGEAGRDDGVLTANHLYTYVRDNVSRTVNRQNPMFGHLDGSGPGEFVFHFEAKVEFAPEVRNALHSTIPSFQNAGIWALENLATGADSALSFQARKELSELATSKLADKRVGLAAQIATKVSIPIIEAEAKQWIVGPLFNREDSSTFDRVLAGLEYDGHDNFYFNNDTIDIVSQHGLDAFGPVPMSSIRRFAQVVIRAATYGSFGPQAYLKQSLTLPDKWLEAVANETATVFSDKGIARWSSSDLGWLLAPLFAWTSRRKSLPEAWMKWLSSAENNASPFRFTDNSAKSAFQALWQGVLTNVAGGQSYEADLVRELLKRI
jgi:hypothetical protein